MKNITLKTLKVTLVLLGAVLGTSQEIAAQGVVVSGEPLAEALVKQWILDYNKSATGNIAFKSKAKASDLTIQFLDSDASNNDLKHFSIAKVAILPVAKSNAP